MLNKLKERWNVKTNFQLLIIFLVFSISGSSALYLRGFVYQFIHYDPSWPIIAKVFIYILTIFPIYQLCLLTYGILLGQFQFFWNFEKKMLRRFGIRL